MKLIFMALLVANIVFFGYEYFGIDKKETGKVSGNTVVIDGRFAPLQLLSERAKTKGREKEPQKTSSVAASSEPVDFEKQCQLIGPYAELLHAEYLVERLHGLDAAAEIKHIEIADGKNFWVYLKPEMSEKEALRRLNEIQAKQIDSYIIPSGDLANGISFGQFASSDEANKKAEQIRAQGYAADIKEVPKGHTEIWVEVKLKKEQKINDEQWLDLLKEEKSVERRQNYCLGVANP